MQTIALPLWSPTAAQGWWQLADLGAALVLSTVIGLEREARQKSAGLRTHSLVGLGSALFVQVSQYGFPGGDPARVAAQVVSGIGFIGGGLIFVRRDAVRGLTTAATVWLTCAVGMACGAGLDVLALACTGSYFVIVRGYPVLVRLFAPGLSAGQAHLVMTYVVGTGLLPRVLEGCAAAGFRALEVQIERLGVTVPARRGVAPGWPAEPADRTAQVQLVLEGRADVHQLAAGLAELDGVLEVAVTGVTEAGQ